MKRFMHETGIKWVFIKVLMQFVISFSMTLVMALRIILLGCTLYLCLCVVLQHFYSFSFRKMGCFESTNFFVLRYNYHQEQSLPNRWTILLHIGIVHHVETTVAIYFKKLHFSKFRMNNNSLFL